MLNFAKVIVKRRKLVIIISLLLLIPSILGFLITPVNYNVLDYLPDDMDSVKGQHIFQDEFGKGAFAMIMVDDMDYKDVAKLKGKIEKVDSVDQVVWYDTVLDTQVPEEILPNKLYDAFNSEKGTLMAAFFSKGISEEETINAVAEIRKLTRNQAYISSMTSFVLDLKELSEKEEPIYVALAVALALLMLCLFLDSYALGVIMLIAIGITIVYNMGSNLFLGNISYITFAIAAVLQLAVTADYSVFLWHSYQEHRESGLERDAAMAQAITKTMSAISGSALTTIAGFIALCFMSFTLGLDLGVVMAKGVVLGLIGSVTILPSLLLISEPLIEKTRHKALNIEFKKLSSAILKYPMVPAVIAVVLLLPATFGYTHTDVYYELYKSVPEDLPFRVAADKLADEYGMASTHVLLTDSDMSQTDEHKMIKEMEKIDGVKAVLGMGSLVGPAVPEEILPGSISSIVDSGKHRFMMIVSDYPPASDEVNKQIDDLTSTAKKYSKDCMLIGEAPGVKDLIKITDRDFKTVTWVSVLAIFFIIALVLQSISLPIILVGCIELAIMINLGIPYFTGTTLSFIDSICIGTIQLGATVDYAILLTTRYKRERIAGRGRYRAIKAAHQAAIPSVLTSAACFFASTVGVAIYSNINLISSMVGLMARGALISMIVVLFVLPAFLYLFDRVIIKTTKGMKDCPKEA